jgi:hypothetical protein
MTPAILADGLAVVGLRWTPTLVMDSGDARTRPGLYTWVDGRSDVVDPRSRGILYIGISESGQGVGQRISDEESWRGNDHAHGSAIARRDAVPLVGEITSVDGADLSFVARLDDVLNDTAMSRIERWQEAKSPLQRAEEFAVRLSIHLGDTVSPVNSQYAGAWNNDHRDADWAAYAVARWLERREESPVA